ALRADHLVPDHHRVGLDIVPALTRQLLEVVVSDSARCGSGAVAVRAVAVERVALAQLRARISWDAGGDGGLHVLLGRADLARADRTVASADDKGGRRRI